MESLAKLKSDAAAAAKNVIDFINSITDQKSLIETDAFMRSDTTLGEAVGEGVVTGFATVNGEYVSVFAINGNVLKGAIGKRNSEKIVKCINNAVRASRPLIGIFDTQGARIDEGVDALGGYSDILRAYTIAYGEVPIISIVKGFNLGMLSFVTTLSDFTITMKGSVVATASPVVLSAKANVDVSKVGGSDVLEKDGLSVCSVKDAKELKTLLSKVLNVFSGEAKTTDDANRVCKSLKCGVDAYAIIKEAFDKDSFLETRKAYANEVVTGFASLGGITVGIVGTVKGDTEGKLTADGCIKIGEHLNTCALASCPVVFLTDCTGFIKEAAQEPRLIREAGNLIYQINNLETDTIALLYGKAVGAAYTCFVAPCEYKLAWDCATVSAMESEAAARLLYGDDIAKAKNKDKAAAQFAKTYEEQNCATELSKSGNIDNVIEPNFTRQYLIAVLQIHLGY